MRRRRVHHDWALLGAVTLVGLVCVLVLWSHPGPADSARGAEDNGGLVLSTDRVHWSPSLTEPIFDPAKHWSPGESGSHVVYVRNDGRADTRMQVSVGLYGRDRGDASWAVVSSRAEAQGWTSMQESGSTTMLRGLSLRPGDQRRVELRATVDALATHAAMSRELRIDIDVRPDATEGVRAGTSTRSFTADARPRLVAATVGGLWAFLGLGVVRRRRVEQLA